MNRIHRYMVGALLAPLLLAPHMVAAEDGDYEAGQIVVSLQPGHTIDEVNMTWGTTTLDAYPEGNLYLLDATNLGDVEALGESMESDPAILEAEANYFQETPESIRHMVIVVVGGGYVEYEDQEIGQRIGLEPAHQMSRGAGITVAVLDTGIDPDHEAFQGRISPDGYDFVDGDPTPWDTANGIDDDQDLLIDEGHGHGTMVSGILALVAPEATILPVRILNDEGTGDAYTIAKGIRYALLHGADVLNLSWGIPRRISLIGHQLEYARELGAVIVAGAGNENLEQAYFPALLDESEMVTAVDSLDVKASFADWHAKVLVSAPGTGVRSAFPGGQWAVGQGCSFATPFVAGEAALIRSLAPGAPPQVVRNRMRTATVPIDQVEGNEPYQEMLGSGRIFIPDALADLASVQDGDVPARDRILVAPNPTRGYTRILMPNGVIPSDVAIFDVQGRLVRRLRPSGSAPLLWDGMTQSSRNAAPGVYVVRASGQDGTEQVTRLNLLP